jgi:biofilm protein TabA
MIVDRIENAKLYPELPEKLKKALQALGSTNFAEKENGRYDIDGEKIYYLVQRYTTKPVEQGRLEAHEKYIDIQYLAEGSEIMGYCPLDELEVETPYNEQKDIVFYKTPANVSPIVLSPGVFAILYPQDAHAPKCQLKGPSEVLKVVVKVKIK